MTILLIWLILLIIILIIFIYNIQKTDNHDENQETIEKNIIKNINIENELFFRWLSDIKIEDETFLKLKAEIQKVIVWMDQLINSILISVLVSGHILVEWVPWLAKTKTIETLSKALDLWFKRIQFTPDMLPSDIIWVEIYNTKKQEFEIKKGPVFTNILLTDEINRTTPKVQSALLEAMEEKKISIWWETLKLPDPFFVMATQNSIEQEWTYPLPEAQIDRFLFKTVIQYPTIKDEKEVLNTIENEKNIHIEKIINTEDIKIIQDKVEKITISDEIKDYIVRLTNKTRETNENIIYGSSPRWSISLLKSAKALAYLQWRDYVIHEDIQRLCLNVFRHRILLSYDAKLKNITEDSFLIDQLTKVTLE